MLKKVLVLIVACVSMASWTAAERLPVIRLCCPSRVQPDRRVSGRPEFGCTDRAFGKPILFGRGSPIDRHPSFGEIPVCGKCSARRERRFPVYTSPATAFRQR